MYGAPAPPARRPVGGNSVILLLLSKSDPLRWAPVWFAALWAALLFRATSFSSTHDKKKDTTHVVSFFLGSGRRRRPPPFGIEMLRAAKPFLHKVFSLAKTLYGAHAPPALQAGLEILSLRVYFMAHATSNWLRPFLPCCASPTATSSICAAAQTKWSCLICSIRWMTGTPKGHLFSQLPQAMQSSAFAGSAW